MKIKNIIILILFFLGGIGKVFAQIKEKQMVVFKGTVDTAYNGEQLVIYNHVTGDHDSVTVKNGMFELSVNYKEPTRYMFYSKYEAKKKGGYAPYGILIAKPGAVYVKADMETLANSVVENNPENDLYTGFIKQGAPDKQEIEDKLQEKFGGDVLKNLTPKSPKYAMISKYYHELNNDFNQKQMERLGIFIKLHPNAFASVYLLNMLVVNIPAEKAQLYYDELGGLYKNTSYAITAQKTIAAKIITAIGNMAPDFEQPDTAGKLIRLSDFRGQYVLLDFWASWCGPCREENPNVVKAYQQFHNKGFTVLSVSLDQPGKRAAWLNAIHHDHLTWTQVSDLLFWNNAVGILYGIKSIPQNFLIDKNGKIIAVNLKGDELNKKLSALLSN